MAAAAATAQQETKAVPIQLQYTLMQSESQPQVFVKPRPPRAH